jgi:hypothetical protein
MNTALAATHNERRARAGGGNPIHTLELPRLQGGLADSDDRPVLRWGKFLAATTDKERERLAMNNPDIARAKEALDQLSADPAARALARERELAVRQQQRSLQLAEEKGEARGEARGEAKAARRGIEQLCQMFGVELTPSRRELLAGAAMEDLERLLGVIAREREWPSD